MCVHRHLALPRTCYKPPASLLRLKHTGSTESQSLTTITRTIGPAKLQISGSWMEIQQKSGFP